jgi:hypothetical protein
MPRHPTDEAGTLPWSRGAIRQLVVATNLVSTLAGQKLTDPREPFAHSVSADGQGYGATFYGLVGARRMSDTRARDLVDRLSRAVIISAHESTDRDRAPCRLARSLLHER